MSHVTWGNAEGVYPTLYLPYGGLGSHARVLGLASLGVNVIG